MVRFIIRRQPPVANGVHDLHSTMVRFIMNDFYNFYSDYNYIYIPLWLDLLYFCSDSSSGIYVNLHSTMVRFIIRFFGMKYEKTKSFTY